MQLHTNRTIKAIIFDFDGVIVESMRIKADAFRFLFNDYPEHIEKIIEFHYLHGGMSRFDKFEWIYKNLFHRQLSESEKNRLADEFSKYAYKQVLKCPFVNGSLEFLNKYCNEFSFFIVSGTPQNEIRSIVEKRKISHLFKEVFGSPVNKSKRVRQIIETYNLIPKDIVFIGDALDDYEAAKEANIYFIPRLHEDNEKIFADLRVENGIRDFYALEDFLLKNKKIK